MDVIDCDAVVTILSSLLADVEPGQSSQLVQQEESMEPAQSEQPEVMDRASAFLR